MEGEVEQSLPYILQTHYISIDPLELTKQVFYFVEDLELCTQ